MNAGRFEYVSTTICRLKPYNGNKLWIDDKIVTIPSAGVDLASTGLAAGGYYVYARLSGSTIVLEATGTSYVTDPYSGYAVKSGDRTRTLVGLIYLDALATFVYTPSRRMVVSWLNRRPTVIANTGADQFAVTTAGAWFGLTNVNVGFIVWADAPVVMAYLDVNHRGENAASLGNSMYIGLGLDGVTPNSAYFISAGSTNKVANQWQNQSIRSKFEIPSGAHTMYGYGYSSGGQCGFQNSLGAISALIEG
jgi:hypothetical protein